MKRSKARIALLMLAMLFAGTAVADELLYTILHPGGGFTEYYASPSGHIYSISCDSTGTSCVRRDFRQQQ